MNTNKILKILFIVAMAASCNLSFAEFQFNKISKNIKATEVKTAKIFYSGGIREEKIIKFISVLDELEMHYPNLNTINLYIHSYGGDMNSGYLGFLALKNVKAQVNTINVGNVESAATFLFCAGKHKLAFKNTNFLLHPASKNIKGDIKPDVLDRIKENLARLNQLFQDIYKDCTKLTSNEIKNITTSEDTSLYLDTKNAKAKGLIDNITNEIPSADISFYFND